MADQAQQGSGVHLAQEVWSRRKWSAILVFMATFSLVVSVVNFLPSIYRATATVLIEREQVPATFVRPAVTVELDTRLQTISEQTLSRARLLELVNLFDLYPEVKGRAPLEHIVERMRRDIKLELKQVEHTVGRGATVAFALSYRGRDPQKVANVANTLASFYIEENWKIRGRQATETTEFFKVQLDEMRKRLEEQERRVGEAKRRYPGESPPQMQANLLTLERLSAQLRLNIERLTRLMERREILARQLAEAAPRGAGGGPSARADRLGKLKEELIELRRSYTEKYPDVIRLKAEIAAREREAEAKPDAEADPAVQRLRRSLREAETDIDALKDEEKRLKEAIAAYQRRIENTAVREQEFTQLLRDYETMKDLYSSLLRRYTDAQQAEHLEQDQKGEKFSMLDRAVVPNHAVAPNHFRLIAMGLMLSLALAVGVVVAAEQVDTSFHTVDSLRGFTSVPVLVSIPPIVTDDDIVRQRRRAWLIAAASAVGLLLIVGMSYFIAHGNEQLVSMLARGGS
ncbi:MAG: hypothetical protein HY726_09300 [Candidatus Rokubacteria bacterium]|nr:hypothetical protein [Candidatus Rokubacteria bacterium]